MDGDPFPAAERIMADIESIFKKDPKLKEFRILPETLNENKSPIHHEEHCLGLESWCVPHLYCHIYNQLMDIRQRKRRQVDVHHFNQLLIGASLLDPANCSLFWNMRRELVCNESLDSQFEFHLTRVILLWKPKSPEVFSYRKWLIKKLFSSFLSDPELLINEFHVCEKAAELYPNNYYAWNHRIWCLDSLSDPSASISVIVDEWQRSHKWVSTHVSDYSGFHYRQKVLQKLIDLSSSNTSVLKKCASSVINRAISSLQLFLRTSEENIKFTDGYELTKTTIKIIKESSENYELFYESITLGLIVSELLFNTDLLITFPGHEAIWCHRRFILFAFQNFTYVLKTQIEQIYTNSHKDFNGVPVEKDPKMECITEGLKRRLISFEEALSDFCKADKDRQAVYAGKHSVWFSTVLKLTCSLYRR